VNAWLICNAAAAKKRRGESEAGEADEKHARHGVLPHYAARRNAASLEE
jgi:hypothetical protein